MIFETCVDQTQVNNNTTVIMHKQTATQLSGSKPGDAFGARAGSGSPVENVCFYFDADLSLLKELVPEKKIILLTDENVYQSQAAKFEGFTVIRFPAGEEYKQQETVSRIIHELIALEAGRDCFLAGVGGGVVTDIAGYVAAIYMRGVSFGLVPTTILAMVDAAIGGKNGVDVGVYKNMTGTIRQPSFILYDYSLLESLPVKEWVNGFAEIIKHACIKDALLFQMLEKYSLHEFQSDASLLAGLIERNAAIKSTIVIQDEFEKGERRLLNFGHTIGHAIENLHQIPHGHAVSIGMVAASALSEKLRNFHYDEGKRIVNLLSKYHLPVDLETDHARVFEILKMDKKRERSEINFILLDRIGSALVQSIPLATLQQYLNEIV